MPAICLDQGRSFGTNACLYYAPNVNGFVWGGTFTNGQFQCNSPSSPLGSASNTFVPYLADDSSGVLYFRLAPDAGDFCGLAAVTPSAGGTPQLVAIKSCTQTDPAEQVSGRRSPTVSCVRKCGGVGIVPSTRSWGIDLHDTNHGAYLNYLNHLNHLQPPSEQFTLVVSTAATASQANSGTWN